MTLKPRKGGSASRGQTKDRNVLRSTKKRDREDKEAVLLVAQEIKFARALAGNEKKSRDRVLKTLRKWVAQRCSKGYEFKEEDFMRIWKGLFYAMWMSDKPLIQEELSESIASILDAFPAGNGRPAVLFFKCALQSLATEWYGIDQHRMDKFLMLARRVLRGMFRYLRRDSWSPDACRRLTEAFCASDGLLAAAPPAFARNALALQIHIADCFAEELAKVSEGSLPDTALVELLRPLASCMALRPEPRLSGTIKRNVFVHLLRQSAAGLDYEERRRAWTQMGCPVGGVDSLEKVPVSDDEEAAASEDESSGPRPLDPRAGRVDVLLPPLPVPAHLLVDMLTPLAGDRRSTTANRHRVRVCIQHFKELAAGGYPLRTNENVLRPDAPELRMPRPARAARRLHDLERRLDAQSDELALRGLSRKHRKRVLARGREQLNAGGDAGAAEGSSPVKKAKRPRRRSDAGAASGEWQVEVAGPSSEAESKQEQLTPEKKAEGKKRKPPTTLQDEVPLKKLKKLLKQKETTAPKSGEEAKSKKSPAPTPEKTKGAENSKPKAKTRENTHNIAKPRVIAKKIGSPVSKVAKASPEKVRSFQKQTEKSAKTESKTKLRGKNQKVIKDNQMNGDADTSIKTTPKKVTIVLKNNTIQGPIDYYKSVKKSPSIPFDSSKKPSKTNLKPNSLPTPIHPFFRKKLRLRA